MDRLRPTTSPDEEELQWLDLCDEVRGVVSQKWMHAFAHLSPREDLAADFCRSRTLARVYILNPLPY